ncbi:MAG: gamma carbonic anhydrase family protein [Caldimonas sp.]
MAIYEFDGQRPDVHPTAWVADSAQVIGNVTLAEGCSVWFGVVIRGDGEEPIRIGPRSNVQDSSVLHADPGKPLTLGADVSIGHLVMLHGCTIGDGALVGVGAVVLNGAEIGANSIVGAGAVVTEGKVFPAGSLIIGSPARAVRELSPEQAARVRDGAAHYVDNARRFRAGLKKIG